jgi:hypothetical protein
MTTNITADHRAAFEALVSGDYRNFAVFSCFVNGEPAAAIAAVNKDGGNYAITPLFVSVTSSLMLTDHDEPPAGEEAHRAPPRVRLMPIAPRPRPPRRARTSAPGRRAVADGPG